MANTPTHTIFRKFLEKWYVTIPELTNCWYSPLSRCDSSLKKNSINFCPGVYFHTTAVDQCMWREGLQDIVTLLFASSNLYGIKQTYSVMLRVKLYKNSACVSISKIYFSLTWFPHPIHNKCNIIFTVWILSFVTIPRYAAKYMDTSNRSTFLLATLSKVKWSKAIFMVRDETIWVVRAL